MQVSILEGAFFDKAGNIRPSYPMNMFPVLGENGFSKGYLRTAPGLTQVAAGPGPDRGSIIWNGTHYRVMGSKLVTVAAGVVTVLGDVGTDGNPVKFDYGFDRLSIASNKGLFYWVGGALVQVTDPNLGVVLDQCWIDGYYMTTDGTNLVVTELSDPTKVNPVQFEVPPEDPSPVMAVMRVRDEIYAVTSNSIQNFQNVGGTDFPFQVNPAGLIPKGACGTHAVCYYADTLAFVGCGRNEALSVYLAGLGSAISLSTTEVDRQLKALTPSQQAAIEVEGVVDELEQHLLVHLPTKTLVYHRQASLAAQRPIWTQMAGGPNMDQAYPVRHFVCAANAWIGGSTAGLLGQLDETVETQLGQTTSWQFDTLLLYNGGNGAILKSAELVGTPGLAAAGQTPTANLSWTKDGQTWSQQQPVSMGASGEYAKRMQWRPKTRMRNILGLRFQGSSPTVAAFGTLEADLEPLNG